MTVNFFTWASTWPKYKSGHGFLYSYSFHLLRRILKWYGPNTKVNNILIDLLTVLHYWFFLMKNWWLISKINSPSASIENAAYMENVFQRRIQDASRWDLSHCDQINMGNWKRKDLSRSVFCAFHSVVGGFAPSIRCFIRLPFIELPLYCLV